MSAIRLSLHELRVLNLLKGGGHWYGAQIASDLSIMSGTIYPLLNRLVGKKLIKSRWETGNPVVLHRPMRLYYYITNLGFKVVQKRNEEFQ